MPSKKFKVQSQLFETIELKWRFPFRQISVHGDDVMIAKNLTALELQSGKNLMLQDGTRVKVRHSLLWSGSKFEIEINGHPILVPERQKVTRLFGFFF